MKNSFLFILFFLVLLSCSNKKDHLNLEFNFSNLQKQDSVLQILGDNYNKTIHLKSSTFKDTVKLNKPGYFSVVIGRNQFQVYLANNKDLKVKADLNDINNTLAFSGKAKKENSFLQKKINGFIDFNSKTAQFKDTTEFIKELNIFSNNISDQLTESKFDSVFFNSENNNIKSFVTTVKDNYINQFNKSIQYAQGNPAPAFMNCKTNLGGSKSLSDYKGKYVLINIWASWCKPCLDEIPMFNKLKLQYPNINFVHISIDNEKDQSKWTEIISKNKFSGDHLIIGDNQKFINELQINSVPRLILIDPNSLMINHQINISRDFETLSNYLKTTVIY
jgi:thiol-disulfide isomerase/thioredoxin